VQLRRVDALPPYVFAAINDLKLELRRAGEDVVDLGFGNPDVPSPPVAVEKLREAVLNPRNHRYSASRGIPNLRRAICDLYARRFGVELDPESQALTTIGAKEGLAHLMWVLVQPGDAAVVPSPSYPIHLFAPAFAGAVVERFPVGAAEEDLFGNVVEAFERSRPRPRVLLLSFPHNPTTATVESDFMQRIVDFAREQEVIVVHDFAYADLAFDGHSPPSILQADGAAEVAVELYTLTKSFSMAGWRVGFVLGNAEVVQALARLKSYLDYGTFQPIQIASIVALNEAPEFPAAVCEIYRSRRDALCDGLDRIGWAVARPRGTMFVWAPIPEPFRELGSLELAVKLAREARVAVSPGIGFGLGGDGHVRFALVENEQRIGQAVAGLRRALPDLGSSREREAAASPVQAKPPPNGPRGGR
jgi:alanine-synthesizing transaminase